MTEPKILVIDIETKPNLVHSWGLFNQNIGLPQLIEPGGMICFAAKWHGKGRVMFSSVHHDGHEAMVKKAWDLIDQADIVVHYNGQRFDVPHLQREFIESGMLPPSPIRQVDLLKTVKSQFRFTSNKLDHVTRQLGIEGKVHHAGHLLWVQCMEGDPQAWKVMKRYNMQDVRITEKLYDKLLPWLRNHPNVGLWVGEEGACPKCGSTRMQRRGTSVTLMSRYVRYHCQDCGSWSRGNARVGASDRIEDKS